MNKLKISTRLTLLLGILSLLLIGMGGIGLFGIGRTNAALRTVYEDCVGLVLTAGRENGAGSDTSWTVGIGWYGQGL